MARGANTWGSFAVRAEAERGVDQEEQPGRGCRLQQLQPGEPSPHNQDPIHQHLSYFDRHHDLKFKVMYYQETLTEAMLKLEKDRVGIQAISSSSLSSG